ncbi:hypothetical protein [Sorangium sp. So ce233]|uniref:hypothetical protein n=1 Tax=Sorangium sp. So ce233 TaxID=3133290 RepID=UPI003F601A60
MTVSSDDPIAPFPAASPEQRAACPHPPDDRAPVSGDGWLCCLCGADCAPPEQAPADLTAERLDELDRRARETFIRGSFAAEPEKVLSAAVLALSAEVRRLREENARMRSVVEAAEAWGNEDPESDPVEALRTELKLTDALGEFHGAPMVKPAVEPPRAREEQP